MNAETNKACQNFLQIRALTEKICQPLTIEDYVVQGCEMVSPPKWHLAHTTWFFENFILLPQFKNYKLFDVSFTYIFNSYYHGIGHVYPRNRRGILSRPTVQEILNYRHYVNNQMINYLTNNYLSKNVLSLLELGLNHEQQHQELLLMDIKYNFSLNLSLPSYRVLPCVIESDVPSLEFYTMGDILADIGNDASLFCFDNELPVHKKFIHAYEIANRLITNGEYLEFILDKGYESPQWWLMEGWEFIKKHNLKCPLYWKQMDGSWYNYTLGGIKKLICNLPVSHVSYYEADAFARWSGARLPLEEEWEHTVKKLSITKGHGNFLENENYQATPATPFNNQFLGDLWEWTNSSYCPYPGFIPLKGLAGEYNGKFMNNQQVLKGGSCVTPISHIRITYRNYFSPGSNWIFSGIRLARNVR